MEEENGGFEEKPKELSEDTFNHKSTFGERKSLPY